MINQPDVNKLAANAGYGKAGYGKSWHGTEVTEKGTTHSMDAVSPYPPEVKGQNLPHSSLNVAQFLDALEFAAQDMDEAIAIAVKQFEDRCQKAAKAFRGEE